LQGCNHVYDPHLGWTANPNYTSPHFNVGRDGFRLTGPLPPGAGGGPVVLATGDSFTEGDEVDDTETWPAHLQAMLGRRVVNAGVSAFGLDQMVLRTEEAVARVHPALGIMAFVPDDLRRDEFSRLWSVEKPYFVLQDGKLDLRNEPVPPPSSECDSLPFWQQMLGWSVMADYIVRRLGWPESWLYDNRRALPEGEGEKLVCPLIQRLSRLSMPILVVAQFGRGTWDESGRDAPGLHAQSRHVLDCAAGAGLATLELSDTIEHALQTSGADALYKNDHHSNDGNRLVAQTIADELARRQLFTTAGNR
jgi:hypothetical protein